MPESPLKELGFPVTIGATSVPGPQTRFTGPEQARFPAIRDFSGSWARVTVEIDTHSDRVIGYIDRVLPGSGYGKSRTPERIVIKSVPRAEGLRPLEHTVKLPDVLAFRVLKVEVPEDVQLPLPPL